MNTILKLQSLRIPSDWSAVFGRHTPIHLEIGFGDGRFIINLARKNPEINFVGVEVAYEFVKKASRKAELANLWNVRFIPIDAYIAIGCLFKRNDLHTLYSNFPDPWPRKRHAKRRLFTQEFAFILADRIHPDGRAILATDSPEFRDFALENMLKDGYFASEFKSGYLKGLPDGYPRTKYAEKWLAEGKELYFLSFKLVRRPERPFVCPIKRSIIMPHVILKPVENGKDFVTAFQPFDLRDGEIFVRYVRAFLSHDMKTAMVEAYVGDWRLVQRILIAIKFRREETLVKLDHINHPVVTEGVKLAVKRIAMWIAEKFDVEPIAVKA